MSKFINFTHVPKCAGTAFYYSLIRGVVPDGEVFFPCCYSQTLRCKENYRYMRGHWPFGVTKFMRHNDFLRNGVTNIVAFREPISQAKSLFRYCTLEKSGAKECKKNLEDGVVAFYRRRPYLCNLQTKYLLGILWVHHRSPLGRMRGKFDRRLVKLAADRLCSNYDFVLMQEDTLMGFEYVGEQLGLTCTYQRPDLTATADAQFTDELKGQEKSELQRMFNLDRIFYDWVKDQYARYGLTPEAWRPFR